MSLTPDEKAVLKVGDRVRMCKAWVASHLAAEDGSIPSACQATFSARRRGVVVRVWLTSVGVLWDRWANVASYGHDELCPDRGSAGRKLL